MIAGPNRKAHPTLRDCQMPGISRKARAAAVNALPSLEGLADLDGDVAILIERDGMVADVCRISDVRGLMADLYSEIESNANAGLRQILIVVQREKRKWTYALWRLPVDCEAREAS